MIPFQTCNALFSDVSKLVHGQSLQRSLSAKRYGTFIGVCPLHQASYLAPYEESESFAACLTYLQTAGDQTLPAIRYLLAEFMKYLLHRGRFYYPQELPAEADAKKAKEGHIARKLWVPLEDLRTGWQQSGQAGQEVYGSAAAFVATSRSYQRDPGCPILIFCEYPVLQCEFLNASSRNGEVHLSIGGTPDAHCRLRIMPIGRRSQPSDFARRKRGAKSDQNNLRHVDLWILRQGAAPKW